MRPSTARPGTRRGSLPRGSYGTTRHAGGSPGGRRWPDSVAAGGSRILRRRPTHAARYRTGWGAGAKVMMGASSLKAAIDKTLYHKHFENKRPRRKTDRGQPARPGTLDDFGRAVDRR